ncbi:hypothetical protein T4B_13166 [Trichinella pseudospiralis]|uniref:Secreted protein n=1 Tax=Trichinella pseudospiralis TaxID=6337 RepID=A0A0V1INP3_TRIPS|nr:hypothetical protein T4B_13166 [Trichinella pseudospiralis]
MLDDRFRSLFTHLSMQTNTAFLLLCFVLCVSLAHSASALSNSAQCMVNAIVTRPSKFQMRKRLSRGFAVDSSRCHCGYYGHSRDYTRPRLT